MKKKINLDAALSKRDSISDGLSRNEAARRLETNGPNSLHEEKEIGLL